MLQTNSELKELLAKNTQLLKDIDSWIDCDLSKPQSNRITFSS